MSDRIGGRFSSGEENGEKLSRKERKALMKEEAAKTEEERMGTWADTGYHASDAEAHRDVRYEGASSIGRMMTVFMTQMKLFSSNKWTFIMIFAAVMIPVILIVLPDEFNDSLIESCNSVQYIGNLLCLMPVMISFFTAFLCGTQIPNEFKDRTAYMSIPLPMSRLEFYFGKFLAGFVLCLGVFLMAYGFAAAMAMMNYDNFYSDIMLESLFATVVSVFAFSATAFCIGSFMRRGSAVVPLALMLLVLPAVAMILDMRYDLDWLLLLPCFLPDSVLGALGAQSWFSLAGMMSGITSVGDMWTMIPVGIVWGILLLALGAFKTKRREM